MRKAPAMEYGPQAPIRTPTALCTLMMVPRVNLEAVAIQFSQFQTVATWAFIADARARQIALDVMELGMRPKGASGLPMMPLSYYAI